MSFYPAKCGNSGKNLRVFWGGINVRSDTYNDKMPTDTDLNILYEFMAQSKAAFPWIGDNSHYVQVRAYRISEKSKKLKRIRMRAFHNGQFLAGIANFKITCKNCTVTNVSKAESGFDEVFDVTEMTGEYFTVAIANSCTNFVTGFEIIEAE